jgi:hypothetical protein
MNSTIVDIAKAHAESMRGVIDVVKFDNMLETASWFGTLGWMTFASTYIVEGDVIKAVEKANDAVPRHNKFRSILASEGQGLKESFVILDAENEIVAYNEPYTAYIFIPESFHPVEALRITHNGKG